MGYFSNGTEGLIFQETYCFRCVNYRDLDDGRGPGCAVWDAHLLYAYEECDSQSNAESILDLLIPRKTVTARDGHPLPTSECAMFLSSDEQVHLELGEPIR